MLAVIRSDGTFYRIIIEKIKPKNNPTCNGRSSDSLRMHECKEIDSSALRG